MPEPESDVKLLYTSFFNDDERIAVEGSPWPDVDKILLKQRLYQMNNIFVVFAHHGFAAKEVKADEANVWMDAATRKWHVKAVLSEETIKHALEQD